MSGCTLGKDNMDTKKIFDEVKKHKCPCVIGIEDNGHIAIALNGKVEDMIYIMHELYWSLHEELQKGFGKRGADRLMNAISKSDEEIDEEYEEMKKSSVIPEWLKKMMDFDEDNVTYDDTDDDEEDEDDSVDETDGDEETGDEEEPTTYHFRGNGLHLDLRIYPDDAVRSDD